MLFQSCVTRDTNIGSTGSQCSSDYLLFYFTEENSFSEYYTTAQSKTPPIHSVSFMCLHEITMTTMMSWDFGSINSGSESICETHCLITVYYPALITSTMTDAKDKFGEWSKEEPVTDEVENICIEVRERKSLI